MPIKTGFIETILDSTEELESPLSYWVWSGLTAISAVSKKLYINRGDAYMLYPNIYVLLLGKSAIRKGPPVALAKRLVKAVGNTRIVSGTATIQAIIEYAAKAVTLETGGMLKDGSCFIVSGEASNSVSFDPLAQTTLVELYDTSYVDDWEKMTISGGTKQIKNPYFVMLGASAQSHLTEFIQERSVEGGYIGRTMLVEERKRHRLNSLTTKMKKPIDKLMLVTYLKEIATLEGEMTVLPEANEEFDLWYGPYNEAIERDEIVDITGVAGRMGDHVWKLAMLWSLSYRLTKVIDADDVKQAIRICTTTTTTANRTALTGNDKKGKSQSSIHLAMVTKELAKRKSRTMSKAKILQRLYPDINSHEFDLVMQTMVDSKWVVAESVKGSIEYTLKETTAEHFRNLFGLVVIDDMEKK